MFFTGKRYLHCSVGTPGWVDMACPFSPFAGLYLNDLCVTWLVNFVKSCPDEACSILFYFDWVRCSHFRGCTENCLPSIRTLCVHLPTAFISKDDLRLCIKIFNAQPFILNNACINTGKALGKNYYVGHLPVIQFYCSLLNTWHWSVDTYDIGLCGRNEDKLNSAFLLNTTSGWLWCLWSILGSNIYLFFLNEKQIW